MVKLVVFDLDGTLADTSEGIINSHRFAHEYMGVIAPAESILRGVIGGPLLSTYRNIFGFSEENAVKAVAAYRRWYSKYGIHQAQLYPGIVDMLEELRDRGIHIGCATLKAEEFANELLENMGVRNFFSVVSGMNSADTRTKADLVTICMSKMNTAATDTMLVGDSEHDYHGALECGTRFIGVSYGFGFRPSDTSNDFPVVERPADLLKYCLK